MSSTHKVEVIRIKAIEDHPNADNLGIVSVYGYQVCVNKNDWIPGTLGAYIPPDSVVPETAEYAWLGGHNRIRAKKLRGVISFGLLVPAPEGAQEGDDVAERMDVKHYEPPALFFTRGDAEPAPSCVYCPKYDLESLRRYPDVIPVGTDCIVTEKIHGASARYVYADGRMYASSHTSWKKPDACSIWWKVLKDNPEIEDYCRDNPLSVVYGEVYGRVQDLRYGIDHGARFAAFDIFTGGFVDYQQMEDSCARYRIPRVPVIGNIKYSYDGVCALAEGPSLVPGANHIREGCVVRTKTEKYDQSTGRMCLKVVGSGYLTRKDN